MSTHPRTLTPGTKLKRRHVTPNHKTSIRAADHRWSSTWTPGSGICWATTVNFLLFHDKSMLDSIIVSLSTALYPDIQILHHEVYRLRIASRTTHMQPPKSRLLEKIYKLCFLLSIFVLRPYENNTSALNKKLTQYLIEQILNSRTFHSLPEHLSVFLQ